MNSTASSKPGGEYALLPFRFTRLADREDYLLTNLAGEYAVLRRDDLSALVEHRLARNAALFRELKARHFVLEGDSEAALHLLAAKYRTQRQYRPELTGLHIFVLTLRCNHACTYCQASHRLADEPACDMSPDVARRALDIVFQSPARDVKIEFQGGEPLLVWDVLRQVVTDAEARAAREQRNVEFVVCSNLSALTPDHIPFLRDHRILLSTSLDGPADVHDANRLAQGGESHRRATTGLRLAQEQLGPTRVAALMTTTRSSLERAEAIIDEYLARGLRSVFLRPMNPYGFAARQWAVLGYSAQEWLAFYRRTLAYILDINKAGVFFREEFAALLLRRMLTPYGDGYVDMQSPTGAGLNVLVYNHDGGVYASDESRMLAEMGDDRFRLGHVLGSTFPELILKAADLAIDCMCEGVPECVDCAFAPFCGSDPVRQYRISGDAVGHKVLTGACRKVRGVVSHLATLLEHDPQAREIFYTWVK